MNLPSKSKNSIFQMILIILSAAAFFCLSYSGIKYLPGIPLALAAIFFILQKIDIKKETECGSAQKIFVFLSAAGTCICNARQFYFFARLKEFLQSTSSQTGVLLKKLGYSENFYSIFFMALAIIGAAAGFYFVYIFLTVVTKRLLALLKSSGLLDFSKSEKIAYAVLFAFFAVVIVFCHIHSNAFSSQCTFSLDSGNCIKDENVFLKLAHSENDIRQPLFAVFAMPFAGIPYLLSLFIPFAWAEPLFTALANLPLLIFSTTVLSRLLHLESKMRIFFVVLASCTFSHFVFSIFIEQYVTAVFYFFLFVYFLCEKKSIDIFSLYGATGTLLTSCVASLFSLFAFKTEKFSLKIKRLVLLALGFAFLLVAFCRSDVFIDSFHAGELFRFSGYASENSRISSRALHFIESATDYFVSPAGNIHFVEAKYEDGILKNPAHYEYSQNMDAKFSFAGATLLLLCILSAFVNRKEIFARFSFFWLVFDFILTGIFGWGIGDLENSLFLYSIYFGWTYLALLFMLIKKILVALNLRKTVPEILCVLFSAALIALNLPGIKKLLDFVFEYYPI